MRQNFSLLAVRQNCTALTNLFMVTANCITLKNKRWQKLTFDKYLNSNIKA